MKNPLTPAGIEPATIRLVAQHLNHCATLSRSPLYNVNRRNAHFIITIFIFNFDVFYMFRTLGSIFRKTVCVFSYGMVRFTWISISSIVGRRVCIKHTHPPTRLHIAPFWPSSIHALCISRFFSYLLLLGPLLLFLTIVITVKRKIHSVPRCIVFSFPVKNYLFSFRRFSTRPL